MTQRAAALGWPCSAWPLPLCLDRACATAAAAADGTGQRLRARHRRVERAGDRPARSARCRQATGDVVVVATVHDLPAVRRHQGIRRQDVRERRARASASKGKDNGVLIVVAIEDRKVRHRSRLRASRSSSPTASPGRRSAKRSCRSSAAATTAPGCVAGDDADHQPHRGRRGVNLPGRPARRAATRPTGRRFPFGGDHLHPVHHHLMIEPRGAGGAARYWGGGPWSGWNSGVGPFGGGGSAAASAGLAAAVAVEAAVAADSADSAAAAQRRRRRVGQLVVGEVGFGSWNSGSWVIRFSERTQ